MRRALGIFSAISGMVGGAIVLAATVSFEQAKSNLSSWLPKSWLDAFPSLGTASANQFAFWFGVTLFAVAGLYLLWLVLHPQLADGTTNGAASLSATQSPGESKVGDDKRRGNFNYGTLHGNQIHNEAPQQRTAPSMGHLSPWAAIPIQIRVYDGSLEARQFGNSIGNSLAEVGFRVIDAGMFQGENFPGVQISYADSPMSRELAERCAEALGSAGHAARVDDGPVWKDQEFIRLGVGANG